MIMHLEFSSSLLFIICLQKTILDTITTYRDICESATLSLQIIKKISSSTRYRICHRFIIFHSQEQIKKYPDSADVCGWRPYPERKSCRFKNIWIRVDTALLVFSPFQQSFCILPTLGKSSDSYYLKVVGIYLTLPTATFSQCLCRIFTFWLKK